MEPTTVFVDFSKIFLSKSERKLLRAVCSKPQKHTDLLDEAQRLRELGLVETYEATNEANPQSIALFSTPLGKSYLEYSGRMRKKEWIDFLKWIVPLVLSVVALILAIRANTGRTTTTTTTRTTTQTTQTATSTTQPGATPAAQSTPAAQATPGAANAPGSTGTTTNSAAPGGAGAPAGGNTSGAASGEPGASGEPSGEPGGPG